MFLFCIGRITTGTGGREGNNLCTGSVGGGTLDIIAVVVVVTLLGNKLALQIGQFNPFL